MELTEIIKELCKQIATLENNNKFLQNEVSKLTNVKNELTKELKKYEVQLK